MRILFDNGTPRPLRRSLSDHQVATARQRGWERLSNGDLLDRAERAGYQVVITTDQSIRYQQNMTYRRVAVVVLMNTSWLSVSQRTDDIRAVLEEIQPGEVREIPI